MVDCAAVNCNNNNTYKEGQNTGMYSAVYQKIKP